MKIFSLLLILLLYVAPISAQPLIYKPLPGKKELRDTTKNYLILHYDEGTYTSTRNHLIKYHLGYHYYIQKNGTIIKLIDPKYKANHAGLSFWDGLVRLNRYSIGICLENNKSTEFTDEQYTSLVWLVKELQSRYPSETTKKILGHSEVAIPRGRKHDPGQHFDWIRFNGELLKIHN